MSEEEYENMTVAQLKEILKEKGLPVSGTKKSLIERLTENMETQEHEDSDITRRKRRRSSAGNE